MVHRATVFGAAADAYDRFRPSYPAAVVDLAVAHGPGRAVDVGCGTGKVAVALAARGVDVIGVEPDERMAAVARGRGIDVEVCSLEDWRPRPVELMFAGQSWHWIEPGAGARQAVAALVPGGVWLAAWNREGDQSAMDVVRDVTARVAPEAVEAGRRGGPARRHRDGDLHDAIRAGLAATAAFGEVEDHVVTWVDHVTAGGLVARLATHSAHLLLGPERAAALGAALVDALGGADEPIALDYATLVLRATRR